jgi:hypothetical protein
MKHYIKNAKQCFTDKNVKITTVLTAKTFNIDMININIFTCPIIVYHVTYNNH